MRGGGISVFFVISKGVFLVEGGFIFHKITEFIVIILKTIIYLLLFVTIFDYYLLILLFCGPIDLGGWSYRFTVGS